MWKWILGHVAVGVMASLALALLSVFLLDLGFFRVWAAERVCEPGEIIVSETQVGYGVAETTTRFCCAGENDSRTFGRCNWSSSMDLADGAVYLPSLGVAAIAALFITVVGELLLLIAWRLRRSASS
jgi:hypothetical protein